MIDRIRAMPGGIRLFLVYAFLILAGIGISLRFVVNLAIGAPVTLEGVVVMVLLAYTIFTTTLVLQRKEAARTSRSGSRPSPCRRPYSCCCRRRRAAASDGGVRDPPLPRPGTTGGEGLPERAVGPRRRG